MRFWLISCTFGGSLLRRLLAGTHLVFDAILLGALHVLTVAEPPRAANGRSRSAILKAGINLLAERSGMRSTTEQNGADRSANLTPHGRSALHSAGKFFSIRPVFPDVPLFLGELQDRINSKTGTLRNDGQVDHSSPAPRIMGRNVPLSRAKAPAPAIAIQLYGNERPLLRESMSFAESEDGADPASREDPFRHSPVPVRSRSAAQSPRT